MGLAGSDSQNVIFMIDFGMAKQYKDPKKGRHVPYKKSMACGSPRFMSTAAHEGRTRSRKDDLEALGYLLLYFARGDLPWSAKTRVQMGEMKKLYSIQALCDGLPGISIF
jgi:casein kinase 1